MKNINNSTTSNDSNGMYGAIMDTVEQFAFEPKIENGKAFNSFSKYILVGMGGSHLAAGILKILKPELDIIIHRGYGLPQVEDLKERLVILSSYSGNTEEVLDAYQKAGELGLRRVVITVGGKLLDLAKGDSVAYIQMPDYDIQPRSALALSLISLLKLIGEEDLLKEIGELQNIFKPGNMEEEGKKLAEKLRDHVPIIYSSSENESLAYNWKIKFNETGKIPAFYNVFSELNHNEMTGYDIKDSTKGLSENFYFIFLADSEDHPKIQKRMDITSKLYKDRGLPVEFVEVPGNNLAHKIFNSLALADFAAYFTAEAYGLESEQVPMVEKFKKLIDK